MSPISVPLPVFDTVGHCVKCGSRDIASCLVPAFVGYSHQDCPAFGREHIERRCERCRFTWPEACNDDPDFGLSTLTATPAPAKPPLPTAPVRR